MNPRKGVVLDANILLRAIFGMEKTYSTEVAARKVGVSFRTLNRWLNEKLIRRPSFAIPLKNRTLWKWTDADIAKARAFKLTQKPGPKPHNRKQSN